MKDYFKQIGRLLLSACLLCALAVTISAAAPTEPGVYDVQGVEPRTASNAVVEAQTADIDGQSTAFYPQAERFALQVNLEKGQDAVVYVLMGTEQLPTRSNLWYINQKFAASSGKLETYDLFPKILAPGEYGVWMADQNGQVQKLGGFSYLVPAQAEIKIEDGGRSLSLDDEIYINNYVTITGCDQAYAEANGGLLIWDHAVTEQEAQFGTQTRHKPGLTMIKDGRFGQQTDGIAAKEYADTMYLRAYVKNAEGKPVYGPLKEYSVREYCKLAIAQNKSVKDTAMQLLHFGAAAQTYFNYNTDDMANVVEGASVSKPWNPGLISPLEQATSEITATGDVVLKGRSLSLDGRIMLNFYFEPKDFEVKHAELLFWDKNNVTLTELNAKILPMKQTGHEFGCQPCGFAAKEYGKTVYVCARMTDASGSIHYSDVVAYSPEAYAQLVLDKSTKEHMKPLVQQMVLYGEEARTYFANK